MPATLSRNIASSALAALALGWGAPALAQDDDSEVVRDRAPGMRDVAMTPLADLNLSKDEIPDALQDAALAPYANEKLVDCAAIELEVARLQAVLGPDVETDPGRGGLKVGKVAQSVVGSFIPFRGIIREVSGAAGNEREFRAAIYAGAVRRGYLKGLGQERGCDWPARPATTEEREWFLSADDNRDEDDN